MLLPEEKTKRWQVMTSSDRLHVGDQSRSIATRVGFSAAAATILCCSYLLFIASGAATFAAQTLDAPVSDWIGRAVLLMFAAGLPAALAAVWLDSSAMRFGIIAGATSIIMLVWAALSDPQPPFTSPAERSFLLALYQTTVFGTLFIYRRAIIAVHRVAAIVLALIVVLLLIEVVAPGLFSLTLGRSAGLYHNPNLAAISVGLLCFGLLGVTTTDAARKVIAISAGAILLTLSRTGLLAFALAGLLSTHISWRLRLSNRLVWVAAIVVVGTAAFTAILFTYPEDALPTAARALRSHLSDSASLFSRLVSNPRDAFHDANEGINSGLSSSTERLRLLSSASAALAELPRFGYGLDKALQLAPHNGYLYYALAFGYPGVLVLPLWAAVCFSAYARERTSRTVFFLVAALFSHDVFSALPLVACAVYSATSGSSDAIVKLRDFTCPHVRFFNPLHLSDAGRRRRALAFALAGFTLGFALLFITPMESRQKILPAAVAPEVGSAWLVCLSPAPVWLRYTLERESPPVLLEDDRPLGPITMHADIRERGGGRYWFDPPCLRFSTSDGTDPRVNGRVYEIWCDFSVTAAAMAYLGAAITGTIFLLRISRTTTISSRTGLLCVFAGLVAFFVFLGWSLHASIVYLRFLIVP
ncbi:MAG: O-antigen ligase family protein [Gammaproteobacteria bacterium]